jgi:glutaminyl-peptide cyclotransferase
MPRGTGLWAAIVGIRAPLAGALILSAASSTEIAPANTTISATPTRMENWSGERAMADIATQLRFTPRSLDTPGHEKTINFIKAELAKTSASAVRIQQWTHTGNDGTKHNLTNIIASFDPSNPRRIIVGTHYDSIVRAYRDRNGPDAPMPGANNSASGVAVLLETARVLSSSRGLPIGVDMVFFDGEEGEKSLGAGDPNWMALGSPYFVTHLSDLYPSHRPEKSIIFDMVCYRNLRLNPELSSLEYARSEVTKFWDIGRLIAPSSFLLEPTNAAIDDDQTALALAGIPSFLVIDFEYEPWFNTTKDTIDKCSAESLESVGRTLIKYLYTP